MMASSTTFRPQWLAGSPAGFTLLGVIVVIAVMNIFLGVAVTRWTFVNQRDREIELIWRGEQYSRALQCFIEKRGAPPSELEELLEEQCIRRLYTDPMSSSGEWRILRADDLGEEFAELAAGLAGGSDALDIEPEAGGDLLGGGDPGAGTGLGAGAESGGGRSGAGRSSLLDRIRNRRSKRGSGSQLGSGAGQDVGSTGSRLGSSLGSSGEPSEGDPEMAPDGAAAGRQSLRERTKGRFESRLSDRNLIDRAGRGGGNEAAAYAGVLGVVTSGSGDSIRTYKQKNRYEEWYFTLGGADQQADGAGALGPQLPGQETPLPTDPGTSGIRGGSEERKSRFRRPSLRRGG